MAETDEKWEYGDVLPLRQRRNPLTGQRETELAVPNIIRQSLGAIGDAVTIPGQVASGQADPSFDNAMKVTQGLMLAGIGAPAPAGAMRSLGGLPMKAGRPVMPEGWVEPFRPEAAEALAPGTSMRDQMVQTPMGIRRAPSGPMLSDEGAREVSKLEGEADQRIKGKMAEGTWKGLPPRLPDWIKSEDDFALYAKELAQHTSQTDSMMRQLGLDALQAGHKIEAVEHDPFAPAEFLKQGGT